MSAAKESLLTDLKVSSLARKCLFYRPELIGKGGPHEIKILSSLNAKWNISRHRAQRVDEKSLFQLPSYVYFQGYVIKMSKIGPFFFFLLNTEKNQYQLGQSI